MLRRRTGCPSRCKTHDHSQRIRGYRSNPRLGAILLLRRVAATLADTLAVPPERWEYLSVVKGGRKRYERPRLQYLASCFDAVTVNIGRAS